MASNDHKSAAELEREVEMQRHRVSDTIDEIQTRLSPGQLVDQLMSYTKGGSGEFAKNMGRSAMENPLPVALLGVSLFWLMTGKNPASGLMGGHGSDGKSARRYSGEQHADYYDDPDYAGATGAYTSYDTETDDHHGGGIGSKVKSAAGAVGGLASSVGDKISGAAGKLSGAASSAGDAMGRARGVLHGAGDQVSGARHKVGEGLGHARERISGVTGTISNRAGELRNQASHLQENAMTFFTEQPLVAAALAFAVGAAVGAALPVSSKERELMGETSDNVKSAIKDAARPIMAEAKDVLDDVMEEGKSALHDTMEEGKSALDRAKNRLGESAGHVKDTVSDRVKSAMPSGGENSTGGSVGGSAGLGSTDTLSTGSGGTIGGSTSGQSAGYGSTSGESGGLGSTSGRGNTDGPTRW